MRAWGLFTGRSADNREANRLKTQAITFDFWRTLFRNNGAEERRQLRAEALASASGASIDDARKAIDDALHAFLMVHVKEQRTLQPEDAIPMVETSLGVEFDASTREALSVAFATAILEHPPDLIEGALEAVAAAAQRVPVALLSDSGVSPGSSLEELLRRHDFLDHFTSLVFSGDVGVAKPQSAMYRKAAHDLGVPVEALFHIGDLEPTDIRGALNVGAKAGLFAGDNRRFIDNTSAHFTFMTWQGFVDQLPSIA